MRDIHAFAHCATATELVRLLLLGPVRASKRVLPYEHLSGCAYGLRSGPNWGQKGGAAQNSPDRLTEQGGA